MNSYEHSVYLDTPKCNGCTTCLKHCPTQAIRIRNGHAVINQERCIDCGECIRACPNSAKKAKCKKLSEMDKFKWKIALPAPTLYGQFDNLDDIDYILDGLLKIGFDDVFEVARGADIVSRAIKEKLRVPGLPRPLISSACPAVVRLIQVRFPDLIPHIVDVRQPMEVAAMIARQEFCQKNNCAPEDVGVFFITPCPAKMTAIRNPIGQQKSYVDGAISMMEIYGMLLPHVSALQSVHSPSDATYYGIRWAAGSGEASAVCPDNSLAVDGIQNVIRVLEEIENNRLNDLTFFEGSACLCGCVGGPLAFENNYVGKRAIRKLSNTATKVHPSEDVPASMMTKYPLYFNKPIEPNGAMKLDDNLMVAMQKMERMNKILDDLPGYDCGSCGSPTCRTFAEDIVRGYFSEMDCIHKLREQLKVMAQQMVELAQTKKEDN